MDLIKLQVILLWIAVTCYVLGTCVDLGRIIFQKEGWKNLPHRLAMIGFVPQTVAIILRWVETGHFPYWGTYEVYNSYSWAIIGLYLFVVALRPKLKILSVIFLPITFFSIGFALTGSTEIKEIPSSFLTYWLGIHIFFAKLAYGSGLVAGVFGGLYLMRSKSGNERKAAWLPSIETADYYCYRFAGFAFVSMSLMIGAGAIWAHKAWGRYWGWDPVETWSLVSWFMYGIFLHLRVTMGWKGKRTAWLAIVAVLIIIFAYFGLPLLYDTVHEHLEMR